MKKILMLVLVIFMFTKRADAQLTTVVDTAQYLRDSIVPKTNYYIGKPLNILLKGLKIKVKSYTGPNPARLPDTVKLKETTFTFEIVGVIASQIKKGRRIPNIHIKFAQPITIPKKYFLTGGFLETDDWDATKELYFGKYIISSIEVRGL